MNLLQQLIGSLEHTREQVRSLPIEAAKAANRSTPWGQANQTAYNQAHPALRPSVAAPAPHFLGQLSGLGTLPPQGSMPAVQGVQNPGAMQLQQGSYANRIAPQLSYDQQQPQIGVTQYPLSRPVASQPAQPMFKQYQKASYL